jgi:hypothetical protein
MRAATKEEIVEVWDHLDGLDQEQSEAVAQQFMSEQPGIGVYLLAQSEAMGGEPGESATFELALAVWQALTNIAGAPLKEVSPEAIEAAEEKNIEMLQRLDEGSEMDWQESVRGLVENYNQSELLGFTLEVLMSDHAENPDLAPDSVGMELLSMKTLIDCLDQ